MSFAPEKKSPQMKGIDLAKDVSTLIVRDASGNERKLYIASSGASLDLEKWEMPPIPFEGMMDVRYATNRMMEVGEASKEKVVGINISSVEYPITISWKMAGEMKQEHLRVENEEVELRGNGEKRISNPDSRVSLRLSASSEKELPKTFALYQNYPNPFNPSTTIRYDLPVKSTVSMRIYNLLGEEVRTLVDEVEDAGFRSFEWDASSYASGVYFYRIEAREVEGSLHLVDVKKLVLVK